MYQNKLHCTAGEQARNASFRDVFSAISAGNEWHCGVQCWDHADGGDGGRENKEFSMGFNIQCYVYIMYSILYSACIYIIISVYTTV